MPTQKNIYNIYLATNAKNTGNLKYQINFNKNQYILNLKRMVATIMNRLRIGLTFLTHNYLNLKNKPLIYK